MAILQLPLPIAGNTGVSPNIKTMKVTDDIYTLTADGYLNSVNLQGYPVSPEDEIHVRYNASLTDENQGKLAICRVSIANGVITLIPDDSEGNVILPVTDGNFANFSGTEGVIADDGFAPADYTKLKVVTTDIGNYDPGTIMKYSVNGSANDDNGTAVNLGNIVAGSSLDGIAGALVSCPATSNKGTLSIVAQDNAGNSSITIKNQPVGSNVDYWLTSTGSSNGYIQISTVPSYTCSNLFFYDISIPVSDLNTAGTVIFAGTGAVQVRIREIYMMLGTNYDAGGDKNVKISDGTTDFTVIPAASLKAQTNQRWGSTDIPFPAAATIGTATVAGSSLTATYSGGTTSYATGSLRIAILLEKIA